MTLCHRGDRFERPKPENQERLAIVEEKQQLRVLRGARVEEITASAVTIATATGPVQLEVDQVFVLIGSDLPTDLLAATGIRVQRHHGVHGVRRVATA